METRVGNKFRLGRKIGSGSFGEIYLGALCFHLLLFFAYLLRIFLFTLICFAYFACVAAGTNFQTNEEVAIKLVSFWTYDVP